jgi:hypothetical protein
LLAGRHHSVVAEMFKWPNHQIAKSRRAAQALVKAIFPFRIWRFGIWLFEDLGVSPVPTQSLHFDHTARM